MDLKFTIGTFLLFQSIGLGVSVILNIIAIFFTDKLILIVFPLIALILLVIQIVGEIYLYLSDKFDL